MAEEKKNQPEVVEADVEVLDDNNVVHLTKPLPSGANIITFDWNKINGYTLVRCKNKVRKQDPDVAYMPTFSPAYQAAIASAATGIKYDDILNLKASDFTAVVLKVQAFLLSSQN